jgi:hypothetical protein
VYVPPKYRPDQKVSFQFFGARADNVRIKEAFDKLVEKGALGNFSLVPGFAAINEATGLMLQVKNKLKVKMCL